MKREIWSLTGLRGIAAVLVAAYHFGQPSVDVGMMSRFHVPKAYIAVDCFFMLSGFVLAYNYASLFLHGMLRANYPDFFVKRIARIYPAYFGIALLYLLRLALNLSGNQGIKIFGWKDAVANLLLGTGWGLGIRPVIGDSWSVSSELVCYLFFPLFIWLIYRRAAWPSAIAAALAVLGYCVVAGSGLGSKGWLDVVTGDSLYPLLRAFSGFVLGIVLQRITAGVSTRMTVPSNLLTAVALATILGSAAFLNQDGLTLVGIFLLILSLSYDGRLARSLFGNPVAMFLGRVSYSLYLVHVLFVSAMFRIALKLAPSLGTAPSYWIAFGIYLCLVLGAATLSYEIFEVRGRRLVMSLYTMARNRQLAQTA